MEAEEHRSVTLFRDYLRIKSVHPDPDYASIVKFLQAYADTNGFQCRVIELVPDNPIVVMTIEGTNPSLPSVLNSHTDVVPVFEIGIPALGFSPMNPTPILLHDHNEFLNEKIFLAGIPIFVDIIQSVANVPA